MTTRGEEEGGGGQEEEEEESEDDDDEDVGESSRPSSSQQQQQQHSGAATTSDQGAGLDDGDSGTNACVVLITTPSLLLVCLPMREICVPSLRRGIPRPLSPAQAASILLLLLLQTMRILS